MWEGRGEGWGRVLLGGGGGGGARWFTEFWVFIAVRKGQLVGKVEGGRKGLSDTLTEIVRVHIQSQKVCRRNS